MNLALDATYSLGRDLSGVGVYSQELLQGLAAAHPSHRFTWMYRPRRYWDSRAALSPPNVRRLPLFETFGSRHRLFHGLNQRLPRSRFQKQIVTFHDLFVLTAEYSTPEFRLRFAQQARHAAAEADLIIAVSHFTATQVQTLLNVEAARIRIIPHGTRSLPLPNLPKEKLILSVGAIQDRKNTARLIHAFAAVPAPWRLVLAGSAGFGSEKILQLAAANPRITVTGYVSDIQLLSLYAQASIFAFPSLDEGFGMPILEAMSAGIPVITSNRSAMPEVAGEAAFLVDPENTDAIAHALQTLASNPEEAERFRHAGLARAAQFSWPLAVKQTWAAYEELISLPERQSSAPSKSADPAL